MDIRERNVLIICAAACTLLACNIIPGLTNQKNTPTVSPFVQPTPFLSQPQSTSSQNTAALTEAPSQVAETPAATRPSTPTIIDRIAIGNIPFQKGGGSGAMLVLPDQIWIGTQFGGLQEWDPQTDQLRRTITSVAPVVFFDIEKENNHLWVLASETTGSEADILYLFELPEGDLLKSFTITGVGSYGWDPTRLGISPGKVWVNDMTIDTDTLAETHYESGLPSNAEFACDNNGWMWTTGYWCDGCENDLWIISTDDPTIHKDSKQTGIKAPGAAESPLVLANGKMWFIQKTDGTVYLNGYDIDNYAVPAVHIDITDEFGDINHRSVISADSRYIWLTSREVLMYFLQENGQYQGSLTIGENGITNIGFDGNALWVLSYDEGLVKIAVP